MSGKKRGPSIADGHDSDRSNSSRHGDPESSKKRKFASGASRSDLRNGAARITGQHRGSLVWVKSDPYPWWPGVVLQKGSLNEDRTNGWKVKRLGQTDPPILNVPNFGLRHGLVGFDVDYDAMVAQGVSSGVSSSFEAALELALTAGDSEDDTATEPHRQQPKQVPRKPSSRREPATKPRPDKSTHQNKSSTATSNPARSSAPPNATASVRKESKSSAPPPAPPAVSSAKSSSTKTTSVDRVSTHHSDVKIKVKGRITNTSIKVEAFAGGGGVLTKAITYTGQLIGYETADAPSSPPREVRIQPGQETFSDSDGGTDAPEVIQPKRDRQTTKGTDKEGTIVHSRVADRARATTSDETGKSGIPSRNIDSLETFSDDDDPFPTPEEHLSSPSKFGGTSGAARKKKSKTTTPKVTREKELSEDDSDDDRASEDDFMNWDASLNLPNQPCLAYAIEDRAYHPARVTEYHAKGEKYTVVYWNGTQRKLDRKKFFCKWEAGFRECKLTDELPPELKDQDFVDENFQDPELEDKVRSFEEDLLDVVLGKVQSRRMDLYKQRKNSRLTWIYGAGPLDKNQVNLVASIIEGMLQKWTTGGHAEDLAWVNQYDQNLLVHNVLLAEAIIRLIEATENVCRNDADGKLQLGYKCDWARELVFLKHGSRATSVANGSDGSGGWDVNGRGFGRHNDAGRGGADAVDGVYEASARGRLRVVKNLKE